MSFTNSERGDDWELGDAIAIPVDLDDDPELTITSSPPDAAGDDADDADDEDEDDDEADGDDD